jgi:hypothetical protein
VETRRNLSDLLTLSVQRGMRTQDNQGLGNFNPLRLQINRQENTNQQHMVSLFWLLCNCVSAINATCAENCALVCHFDLNFCEFYLRKFKDTEIPF